MASEHTSATNALSGHFAREQQAAIDGGRFFELASVDRLHDGWDAGKLLEEIAAQVAPMLGARPIQKMRVLITYDRAE